jgi:hypothetical protein
MSELCIPHVWKPSHMSQELWLPSLLICKPGILCYPYHIYFFTCLHGNSVQNCIAGAKVMIFIEYIVIIWISLNLLTYIMQSPLNIHYIQNNFMLNQERISNINLHNVCIHPPKCLYSPSKMLKFQFFLIIPA